MSAHERWLPKLEQLAPAMVAGTRAITLRNKRINEGFVWSKAGGLTGVHQKYFVPNEEGFWEASWYDRGDGEFSPYDSRTARMGFLICSELWSFSHAAEYGRKGAHFILSPRTTSEKTLDKWLNGGKACAIVSGCYSISSNKVGNSGASEFGGCGWVIDPDGVVKGTTSRENPIVTVDVDIETSVRARGTFPRNCL